MDQEIKQEFENLAAMIKAGFDDTVTKEEFTQKIGELRTEILDGVDDKLVKLKGDLIILMRKEDRKVVSLVELLKTKHVITEEEAKNILNMEPFPQLMV